MPYCPIIAENGSQPLNTMKITIILDAPFDLSEAGYGRDENMADAYKACAAAIAAASGIDIEVVEDAYESPVAFEHCIGEGEPGDFLWQGIHDALIRSADGNWGFEPTKAADLARLLKKSV